MSKQKVYIIDYNLISPIALGKDELFSKLKENYIAEHRIQRFNTEGIPFKVGAEIQSNLSKYYSHEPDEFQKLCQFDRKMELLTACYEEAKTRFDQYKNMVSPSEKGIIIGVGADVASFEMLESEMTDVLHENLNPISEVFTRINQNNQRFNLTNNPYDLYSIYLANKFNASAFQKSVLTSCVSSTQAIAYGAKSIENGEVEMVVTGGTDSIINMLATISFGKMGVINDQRQQDICKPWDTSRNGTLAGESAGILLLASEKFIKKNDIVPIAEFLGHGNTLDGYKITAPDPSGIAMTNAIQNCLTNSNLAPADISYINGHGTGTQQNDGLELSCYQSVFGDQFQNTPISSTKSRHGHAIASAGIQEVIVLLESMKNNFIPGNMNLKNVINSDAFLPTNNLNKEIKYALSSNFAFGGINTVLALKNCNYGS
jgi:3-oxoacyl-[acyl-carrier-protein] synthase II